MMTSPSDHDRQRIALIGMRGSGKTTVGRSLAGRLGWVFLDTDEEVVRRAGRSIAEIFRESGEAEFRRLEQKVMDGLEFMPARILSVGGGAILQSGNVSTLRRIATVVWLTAAPGVLAHRVARDTATQGGRPPLTSLGLLEELDEVLRDRSGLYRAAAHFLIDTQGKTPDEVAGEVITSCRVNA